MWSHSKILITKEFKLGVVSWVWGVRFKAESLGPWVWGKWACIKQIERQPVLSILRRCLSSMLIAVVMHYARRVMFIPCFS